MKNLPRWVMDRYALLWASFREREFSFKLAFDCINNVNDIDSRVLSMVLSELLKNGWLESRLDDYDSRKRMYKLTEPNKAFIRISNRMIGERFI